ncbi:putative membrane protein [Bacillus sp. RC54]
MLKTLRIVSALIVIVLALSVIFTNALVTMPYMLIALSVMTFIMSAEEK